MQEKQFLINPKGVIQLETYHNSIIQGTQSTFSWHLYFTYKLGNRELLAVNFMAAVQEGAGELR